MSTTTRTCEGCGATLPPAARPDRRHCTPACRVRSHRRRHGGLRLVTPAELDRLAAAVEPALAEASLVNGIAMAARTDWRSAAWLPTHRS